MKLLKNLLSVLSKPSYINNNPYFFYIFLLLMILSPISKATAKDSTPLDPINKTQTLTLTQNDLKALKGWEYIALKLKNSGISKNTIFSIYKNKKMPYFTPPAFSLSGKEPKSIYKKFLTEKSLAKAENFYKKHYKELERAGLNFNVPKEVIVAILLVETDFGIYTGKKLAIYQLSKLASAGSSKSIRYNFSRLKEKNPNVSIQQVKKRALKLENIFFKEVLALIKISQQKKINIFNIKGSSAGAFGYPQFLPSSYLRYGVDGNKDGIITLFNMTDTFWSIANYLKQHGIDNNINSQKVYRAIWHYNHSPYYVEAVQQVAKHLNNKKTILIARK